jgi:hypothetical protein
MGYCLLMEALAIDAAPGFAQPVTPFHSRS